MTTPYKILIVAPAWVGDAVLAQPLFARLHQRHAELQLDVLAPPWTEPVFARMTDVHATLPAPFAHGELALSRRYALARTLVRTRYDQAIVLPNSLKSALIPWFAAIPLRTGFVGEMRWGLLNDVRRLDEQQLPLMAERFAALAEAAGDNGRSLRPLAPLYLKVDMAQRATTLEKFGLNIERPVAVLCPGAEYGPAKRWPPEYFAALARQLAAKGYTVWLAGSAKDATISAEIALHADGACIDLCGKTGLAQAIDLLSCATLVVSNDSGLMHVAAALDRPLLALYGSSSSQFTPPLSKRAHIIKLDIECSPCFQRVCPLGHFNCMRQLTPDYIEQYID